MLGKQMRNGYQSLSSYPIWITADNQDAEHRKFESKLYAILS